MIDPMLSAAQRIAQSLPSGAPTPASIAPADGPSFGETLKKAIGDVNEVQEGAQDIISAYLRGEQVELHQVMAATEEAGIALEMLVEIRNKFSDAYRTLVNMH